MDNLQLLEKLKQFPKYAEIIIHYPDNAYCCGGKIDEIYLDKEGKIIIVCY